MKHLTFIFLIIASIATAQTRPILSIDAGTQVTSKTDNYSLGVAIGLQNFNNDYATLGFITKTYKTKTLCAGRLMGLIMINEWLGTYMQGDLFVIHDKPPMWTEVNNQLVDVQHNTSRLELSTGIALKAGHMLILNGIQADDYDPIKDTMQQPMYVSKLTFNFNLKKK